jgi:hypothetical protein
MTILKQLETKLPQFRWTQESKHSSIFGVLQVPKVTKRINKDLYELHNVYVYISSKMGGTELSGKPFRYAMCYQIGKVRPYRCKNWGGVEYNKVFVSGKDAQATINELIKKIDMSKYFL